MPIALTGRVPLKVTSENGPIEPGDFLTLSSIPGVAMKALPNNPTVGKALESYDSQDPNSIASIMVYVDLGYAFENISQPNPTQQLFTIDSGNNVSVTILSGAKFVWKNSGGHLVAFVNDSGEAVFSTLTSLVGDFGKLIFGEAIVKKEAQIAGEATFEQNETEVFVASDKIADDTLINLTPITKTKGLSLYIKEKKPQEGFIVALERSSGDLPEQATASATTAIRFNWFILNQK